MDNIAQEKRQLRQKFIKERTQQPSTHAYSEVAQRLLLGEDIWKKAHYVALYMAVRGEMSTHLLLEAAWQQQKCVLLPRCQPESGNMEFVPCTHLDDLVPGSFGIMEPHVDLAPISFAKQPPDLMVIPGTAFDTQGYRLGFGGGYYDKALAQEWCCAHTVCMGLCFAWQVVKNLPVAPWDIPMHALVTEKAVLWV